jgi:hypothetical protein
MVDLAAVIDDYLHIIVRTRPWTKKREEELLLAFSDWFYAQPEPSYTITSVTPATTARYAQELALSSAEHEELNAVLCTLFLWAEQQYAVPNNPFLAGVAA